MLFSVRRSRPALGARRAAFGDVEGGPVQAGQGSGLFSAFVVPALGQLRNKVPHPGDAPEMLESGLGIFAHSITPDQALDCHQTMLSKFYCSSSRLVKAWGLVCLAMIACRHAPAFAGSGTEHMRLSAAREALLRDGWRPWETFGVFPDGLRWSHDGDAGVLYKNGFKEVEACSGTGANYCSFNYVRGGKCMTLHTQGEFAPGQHEPLVIRRSMTCPRPEITRPPQPEPR
ncbi:hypothetical protein EIP75_22710 [Aquabacterium soli]|uniref:Uncharacterized protein n=2 Tax=Aquabacterium soli TaxID=2493092 RepID=A0A3R8RZL5_9BURK|nr:hypothetical protein EIP75_22710 [Aquabacterium soli]